MLLNRSKIKAGKARGFTLLEMIIAMGVLALLLAGIFGVAKSTMELSSELATHQEKAMMKQNFTDYLRRSFRGLPGAAEVRLENRSAGGTYLPSLTVVNGGNSFMPGEALAPDLAVELTAEQRPGGYLRVLLRTLDDKQTIALRSGQTVRAGRNQPALTLMDNVSKFEWRLYDAYSQRWEPLWREARRPLLAELSLQLDDGQALRSVFWIPPVVNRPGMGGGMPGPGMNPLDPNAPGGPGPNPPPSPDAP